MKCKCGNESFFIKENGTHIGLYCDKCGKWVKWATRDEVRAYQYNKSNKQNNADESGVRTVKIMCTLKIDKKTNKIIENFSEVLSDETM